MRELRYTLTTDGSSDRALIPLLSWLLRSQNVTRAIQPAWADLRRLPRPAHGLTQRIVRSIELYPCDLLFVHRDAEREPLAARQAEIRRALEQAITNTTVPPRVCVVPVRMTEAWLLCDERAIRRAAGNPNGAEEITLPSVHELEDVPDPKSVLHEALRAASGLHGRRLKRFAADQASIRITQLISDFGRLRNLPAFAALEIALGDVVREEGWDRQ